MVDADESTEPRRLQGWCLLSDKDGYKNAKIFDTERPSFLTRVMLDLIHRRGSSAPSRTPTGPRSASTTTPTRPGMRTRMTHNFRHPRAERLGQRTQN